MKEFTEFWVQKRLVILILSLAIIYRLLLSYLLFGGGDATNVQSFYLIEKFGNSIYKLDSPWPYFPITTELLGLTGYIAEFTSFDAQHSYRFLLSVVDIGLAYVIFTKFRMKLENEFLAYIALSLYAFNPLSSIVISVLGFIDTLCLAAMFLIALKLEKDSFIESIKNIIVLACLLAFAVSFKPIAIILLPYLLFRSKSPVFLLFLFIIFMHLFNAVYIIEMGYAAFFELINYILIKMTVGHQLSNFGLGAFSDYVPFTYLKLITILGFVFTAIITLYALRSDPFTYLTVVILSILAFRYNTHPQYLLWPLPFLMLSRGIPSSFLYSVVTATLIILNLTFWHSNSSAYAFLELFELSIFADLELAIGQNYADSLLRYLFQAILIFYLLYLIEFHYIKKAFKKALEYFLALIKNINYNRLSLFICLLFLLVYLNRSNIFSENLLYALRVLLINYAPVILVSVLLSSRFWLIWLFIIIFF